LLIWWLNHMERKISRESVLLLSLLLGCSGGWDDGTTGSGYPQSSPTSTPGGPVASGPPPASACIDPAGFGGRGCYRCPPTTNEQLLAACTTSPFERFDNATRIQGFDPNNPRPPLTNTSPLYPPYQPPTTQTGPTLPPAPACPLDATPNPVMVLGATGFPFETLAKAMGSQATIYYLEKASCDGVASMILNEPKLSGEVVTFGVDGSKNRCVLSQSHPADISISALFPQTCANHSGLAEPVGLPPEVQDFLGPVNPVMFVAPATSPERAISAEAAYRVYGLGNMSRVLPWTDETFIFRRSGTSGNQQTVARTLLLPPDGLRGRDSNGSTNMMSAMLTSTVPTMTIGISSAEIVDTHRDVMKTLAYQHYGQPAAFYPDSDASKLDRANVRDGHYFMWLPLHVFTRTSGGDPVSAANAVLDPTGSKRQARDAAVKRLAFVMVNRQQAPLPSVDLFGALKRTGNVPQCAMRVQRAREGAPLAPYTPPVACGCAFDAALPGSARPDCSPCRDSTQCSGAHPTCSFGFCE
jgi:hypothetical protein